MTIFFRSYAGTYEIEAIFPQNKEEMKKLFQEFGEDLKATEEQLQEYRWHCQSCGQNHSAFFGWLAEKKGIRPLKNWQMW